MNNNINEDDLESNFYLKPNELEELNEIFDILKNEDDTVNTEELKKGFEMMKFDRTLPRIYDLICKLPETGDFITREEFLETISENVGHKYTEEAKKKLFETICEKGSDKMTKEDITFLVKKSGETIKESEILEMIQAFSNQKDYIDINDFSLLIQRKFIGYS